MKEDKIRYRAYKKGKFWVFAAIVTSSTLLAFGGRAYADTVTSTEDKVSMTVEEQTQSTTSPISDTTSTEVTSKSEATELSSSESSISTSSQSDQITTAETVNENANKVINSENEASLQNASETTRNSSAKNSWSFNPSSDENTSTELTKTGTLEGINGNYAGIAIDASQAGAKFAPRQTDTQINAGTKLSIPVNKAQYGAEVTLVLAGGTTSLHTQLGNIVNSGGPVVITLPNGTVAGYLDLIFDQTSYLSQINIQYKEAPVVFPGTPENLKTENTIWDLANSNRPNAQGDKNQIFQGIKIDASQDGAKFAPRSSDTQINAATVLYIPIAANQYGTTLSFSLSGGTTSLHTETDKLTNVSGLVTLTIPANEHNHYLAVTFDQTTYLNQIQLSYDKASVVFPEIPENTKVEDTTWDLTATGGQRPEAQGSQTESYQGLKIDASKGKFSPRNTDTQVNAGTILYIPVVADAAGATLSIKGNNYNNLTVTLDGQEIQLGSDIT